ncbi:MULTISPECIES: NADPH-dependent 7-cyano-7-deazaguanine reductase QueF [Legionella]|uniref:NADPH-dependent 7-cyano-7-deazaguanine reductase n=1 Tax=Legionella septentrionalis TaxID=2498109 RepID=A0A3S0XG48_9GAMM|nr:MULTISPECIES: NADPH-dependent 7-cyano-7-deazaguanine reductase QueF [Legionella]MCP0912982.1 NADPH-dependent 7-cyano-7-deazaguanine reductase QueF [Legionella sp. 27cVA30]RUQ85327.1 NADPH-dependent 7-cyano-7-deazaguanine reductase QueF [Legionella septentrionalis]RUQ96872.1 NADPH-dependent 7-cyano-7-deazaguanine reductase QueF [Legionella septentrionalis]RUR15378.1 NADPH-dependent 7-cyano-7-deazaguanine reductase QueF [Legionella septentrionalis]
MSKQVVNEIENIMSDSELGKKSTYIATYDPTRLFPISRDEKRREIGIDPASPPFFGFDCWNHYEVSWLNEKGKPMVALAELVYDCNSPKLIESKSLKLYFNSFNNTNFRSVAELEAIIAEDLTKSIGAEVFVKIFSLAESKQFEIKDIYWGELIDELDIACSTYSVEPSFLSVQNEIVEETLFSNLLKSNCLVTHQPDWGSVQIAYKGKKINREGLLRYIVSFRNHNEFHEQCIERIFVDILNHCKPDTLTVYGRYTRRGGLDINPFRSTQKTNALGKNIRLIRQ